MESDLRDTVNWGRKWLVDFKAGKTQLVLFDLFIDTGAIDMWKWMVGLSFSSKLDGGSCIVSIAKIAYKKIGTLIVLWSFFLRSLLCISINSLYGLA